MPNPILTEEYYEFLKSRTLDELIEGIVLAENMVQAELFAWEIGRRNGTYPDIKPSRA